MVHHGQELKNVEINTISASFGMLSELIFRVHDALSPSAHLAKPASGSLLVDALAQAHTMFMNSAHGVLHRSCVVLMIVQPNECNIYDQLGIVDGLKNIDIVCVRMSLSQIIQCGRLAPNSDLILSIDNTEHIVSVAYFRTCYGPQDFVDEKDWEARCLMESSNAIQCPCLALQLLGMKRLQLLIASSSFPPHDFPYYEQIKDALNPLRSSFMSFLSLETKEEQNKALCMVSETTSRWILKPQREGGGLRLIYYLGNNIYGNNVLEFMTNNPTILSGYILMERIQPEPISNTLVYPSKNTTLESVPCISELGVFGAFITCNDATLCYTESAGHIFRTKEMSVDEGGVAAGYACLDTPFLL